MKFDINVSFQVFSLFSPCSFYCQFHSVPIYSILSKLKLQFSGYVLILSWRFYFEVFYFVFFKSSHDKTSFRYWPFICFFQQRGPSSWDTVLICVWWSFVSIVSFSTFLASFALLLQAGLEKVHYWKRSTFYFDSIIFLSLLLDVARLSVSTISFLAQLNSEILCLWMEMALSLELTDTFYLQVLSQQVSCVLWSFCLLFLVTPCLIVAVQSCMSKFQFRKIIRKQ